MLHVAIYGPVNSIERTHEPGGFIRGVANASGTTSISGSIWILNAFFGGGPQSLCAEAADVRDNHGVGYRNWEDRSVRCGRRLATPSP